MDLQTYKIIRKSTEINLDNRDQKIAMLCMGLAGEAGEMVDYFKKVLFHNHPFDKEKCINEMGDMMWYFVGLIDLFNLDISEILQNNIDKLQKRYPNGWNLENSLKRMDEKENKKLKDLSNDDICDFIKSNVTDIKNVTIKIEEFNHQENRRILCIEYSDGIKSDFCLNSLDSSNLKQLRDICIYYRASKGEDIC